NVWTMMSADEALGYVYLPCSTPSDDFYGVNRPGDGLFGDTLVCLDARTGNRVWHFQMVHHGLWDYDLPCAPNLIDIQVDGKPVKAVAQVSKQGFCYVFRPVRPAEKTGPTSLSGAANPVSISRRLWTRRLARKNSFLHFQALRPFRLRPLDSLANPQSP